MITKDSQCLNTLKKLVGTIQGAPYPGTLSDELYAIWYEHSQQCVMEAIKLIADKTNDKQLANQYLNQVIHKIV